MGGTNTTVAVNSVGYVYLYDLIVAARTAAGQTPLEFPYARRLELWQDAGGTVVISQETVGNPDGIKVSDDAENPTIRESSTLGSNENLRGWHVKGVGELHVGQEY